LLWETMTRPTIAIGPPSVRRQRYVKLNSEAVASEINT
jgi:hypothetical protein